MTTTHLKRIERRTIKLHRRQYEFRHCPALYRGFVGGRSAGKSWVGAYDLIRRAKRDCTYLVASPTGIIMGDTTFPTFKKLATELNVLASIKLTPYPNVTLSTGATVRFRSAEDPDKMRGPNLSGVWLDEASLMADEAYTVAIASLREGGVQGWLSATFTPKGIYHWSHDTFNTGKPDTALFRAHTRENPFNPPGFADTLAKQYSPIFARQELGGEFLEIEGAEWPAAWFPESHWFTDWPAPDQITLRTIGVDSSMGKQAAAGRGDYSAIVALARDRNGTLYAEANMDRRPITKVISDGISFARQFQRETGGVLDGFGVEADVFQELIADEFLRQTRREGIALPVYKILTGGTRKDVRIRRLTPYLSNANFRWRNTPGTQLLIRQAREFPVGQFDDGPDALEQALRLAIDISHERHGQ